MNSEETTINFSFSYNTKSYSSSEQEFNTLFAFLVYQISSIYKQHNEGLARLIVNKTSNTLNKEHQVNITINPFTTAAILKINS